METKKFSRYSTQKNSMHFYHFSYKKTAIYQPRIRHANWIFFQFSNQKTTNIFQRHSHINCMLFRHEFKIMQTDNFSKFSAEKNRMHFYHFSYKKKTAWYHSRIRHANWICFPIFLTRKQHAHKIQHHAHIFSKFNLL